MARILLFSVFFGFSGLASGCGDDGGGGGGDTCASTADCAASEQCIDGMCVARPDSAVGDSSVDTGPADAGSPVGDRCGDTRPCPTGFVCEGGLCDIDCGAEARCAGACCDSGNVCYLGACVAPGADCSPTGGLTCVNRRCPAGQQCDPSLLRCLPIPSDTSCTVESSGTFEPVLAWKWEGSSEYPAFDLVLASPAIIDLDGDGASDVIVPVTDFVPGGPGVGGIICALSGAGDCEGGPRELWCTSPDDVRHTPGVSPAVADLNGDGDLTIVVAAARGVDNARGIYGYQADGTRIPTFGTDAAGDPVDVFMMVGAPGIADLDNDGRAEVYAGFTVFDADGRLLWERPGATGNGNFGPITVAHDLDGDGDLELIGGNMAYRADGTDFWAAGVAARAFADGWPAVTDVDLDGAPEVVVVSNGTLRIFDRDGNRFTTSEVSFPGRGGPPTVADLDGDGRPEVAVAGSDSLSVYDIGPAPDYTISLLWRAASRDFSSNFTGSSVFDFDGDGQAEVLYGDECYARVYDGAGDGAGGSSVRFEVPNTSCTATEYPVVADLNGDGKAEFVVVSNDLLGTTSACRPYAQACVDTYPGYETTTGVRVYRDRLDNWVPTRAIWNQHGYHVTNVCDGRDSVCDGAENVHGRIPRNEHASHGFPAAAPLNSYRVNAELEVANGAPDLVVSDLAANLVRCPSAMTLRAVVTNRGAVGVAPGAEVRFYQRLADGTERAIGTTATTAVLLPGASEVVEVSWDPVPADAQDVTIEIVAEVDGPGAFNECLEDNNETALTTLCAGLS
ncbi:MAG: hypothetical protein DRJ42_12315 [Deltaproteobacteria bacterium]|nr:MAG: hypothetical protein DRJ42_12315 [Deltaproteobacteria bacterium]